MIRSGSLMFLALAAIAACASAEARDWNVDAAKSAITFKGVYQKEPFEGRFKKFDATIAYDAADLAKCKFDVTVDVASVDTKSGERDQTLVTPDFFDAGKHPKAHFVTESFAKGSDGAIEAKGTLTIKDKSKPVVLKVTFAEAGAGATLDVDTSVNRVDFGLGVGGDWVDIGRDIPIHGHLVLTPKS
jgi:polyisoprenoid-binding protein YceI